jgi:hypothetical protein
MSTCAFGPMNRTQEPRKQCRATARATTTSVMAATAITATTMATAITAAETINDGTAHASRYPVTWIWRDETKAPSVR